MIYRIIQFRNSNVAILILVARKWQFRDLRKELSRLSPRLVGSIVDMFVGLASLADSERRSVLATSLAAATVEKLESSAAILMAKEKSLKGKNRRHISFSLHILTS
jgi:hypothetical protein